MGVLRSLVSEVKQNPRWCGNSAQLLPLRPMHFKFYSRKKCPHQGNSDQGNSLLPTYLFISLFRTRDLPEFFRPDMVMQGALGSIRLGDRETGPGGLLDHRSVSHPFFVLVPRILGLSSQPQIHQSIQALNCYLPHIDSITHPLHVLF